MAVKSVKRKNHIQTGMLIAFGVLTLIMAAAILAFALMGRNMLSQQHAERFKGESEERFAQVSAFFPVGKGINMEKVYSFRQTLETKLVEVSLEPPETGSLWQDAFSVSSSISVRSEKGSAEAEAIAVGGDFFAFHPLALRSGHYITEQDLMHDGVVLDEILAWQLFGGTDLEGMTVVINDKPFVVAGVVARETDYADKKARDGDKPGIFLHWDALAAMDETLTISCYELVCADPISGYVLSVVEEAMSDAVAVQNTDRFSIGGSLKVISSFGKRAMNVSGVIYPYWENGAQLAEDYRALFLAVALLSCVFPIICAVWLVVFLIRKLRAKLAATIPARWEKFSDRIREKKRLKLIEREKRTYAKDNDSPGE